MGVLEIYTACDRRPSLDLAFEQGMLERAAEGACCLSLVTWSGPVVVLGYGQDPGDVDLAWCEESGIPVLRRITGGTGVVHSGDLGVSLALPRDHGWARQLLELYGRFLDVLEPALRAAGSRVERIRDPRRAGRVRSPICFEDLLADTLLVDGRKAVGCAQARRAKAVLIHAAVLLGLDPALYARVFRVEEDRVAAGLAPALTGRSWRAVGDEITSRMAAALELRPRPAAHPEMPERLLAPYREPRWAPVPEREG